MVEIKVLGSMAAEVGGQVIELGGPRQRAVLALLLVARCEVVSVDRLIEDLWLGAPPPRALGALQAYISNLRRAIEPDRGPRMPAGLLVSAAPGYALRLPVENVDAWRFGLLVRQAGEAKERGLARSLLEQSLGLWHGGAYAEVADEPWAQTEISRLEQLRLVARERLVRAMLDDGDAADAVPLAEQLTRDQPLREEGWRLLALAHNAGGRRAEALATLRRARALMAEELGLDPGSALVELEAAVLRSRVPTSEYSSRPASGAVPGLGPLPGMERPREGAPTFIGRESEMVTVRAAAAAVMQGSTQMVLVAGDAGAGKSALLEQVRQELVEAGWRCAVGRCPEAEGVPPAWPWVEVVRGLSTISDPGHWRAELAPLLQDDALITTQAGGGRFRLHRAVAGWLATGTSPLLLILDDLHRADSETLALLRSVVDALSAAPTAAGVLLIGAYRLNEVDDQFGQTLADLARHSPIRLRLDGLDRADAAQLIRLVSGLELDSGMLEALTQRTAGNPFYLRESAKLLALEGELVAMSEVPEGVRDVLRRRVARLPEPAAAVLRLAAVLGRDVDVEVLIEAAEVAEADVLDALEAAVLAGLLTEPEPGGDRVRFAHVLIQETLLGDLPQLRRARWHARVAAALEACRPNEYTALAYHYASSGSSSTARQAVDASVTAAGLAISRYAYQTAAGLYQQALECLDRVPVIGGRSGDDERSALYCHLVPALLLGANSVAAREALDAALDLAEQAGRDDLAVAVLRTFNIPLTWLTRGYGSASQRKVALLRRLLSSQELAPLTRCELLCVLVREEGLDDSRTLRPQASEAVNLARGLGDDAQLSNALAVLSGIVVVEYEPALKREIAEEIIQLGQQSDLPGGVALGHHFLMQLAGAQADLSEFNRQLELEVAVAQRYQLVQALDTSQLAHGLLAHIAGRLDESEEIYKQATDALRRHGSVDADGLALLATFTLRLTSGRLGELVAPLRGMHRDLGAVAADLLALALLASGERAQAEHVYRTGGWPRVNFFQLLLTTLRGKAAVGVAAVDDAPAIRERLLPFATQLAGAGTGSFTIGPVAQVLGDLALLLGNADEAREHYRQAMQLCTGIGAPIWAETARASLRHLG